MMEEDLFHEPYRAKLIPHYKELKSLAKKSGACGTRISGAGPTMISFAPTNKTLEIIKNTKEALPGFEITQTNLDNNGLIVKEKGSEKRANVCLLSIQNLFYPKIV